MLPCKVSAHGVAWGPSYDVQNIFLANASPFFPYRYASLKNRLFVSDPADMILGNPVPGGLSYPVPKRPSKISMQDKVEVFNTRILKVAVARALKNKFFDIFDVSR